MSGARRSRTATRLAAGAVVIALAAPARSAFPQEDVPSLELEALPKTASAVEDRRPRWGRAVLEATGALAVATVWYWRDLNLNSRDWDLQWDWPTWRTKFTGGYIRLDRNEFWTNAGSHPRSGAILYTIGRSNGLGIPQSVLLTAGATTVWEYLAEFREMVSLNDMIVNPVAGLAIGEAFFQLGRFFRRGARTPFNWVAATALSPLVTLHDWMDDRPPATPDAVDDLGLSREVWHRFALTASLGSASFDGRHQHNELHAGVSTELVTVPGYGRPVSAVGRARTGSLSGIDADLTVREGEVARARFGVRLLLAGLYRQRATAAGNAAGLLAGVATSFDYAMNHRPGQLRDLFARLGLLGPLVEGTAVLGSWRLRLRGEGYLDFTMVRPHVYQDLLLGGGELRGIKSPIEWYGYYFAGGYTLGGQLVAEHRLLRLAAETRWGSHYSLEGLDRFQEQLSDDFSLRDQQLSLLGQVSVAVPRTRLRLGLDAELLRRSGQVPSRALHRATVDRRTMGSVSFVF